MSTREYFVVANSGAAPFFSDTSHHYTTGTDPDDAMRRFRKGYKHPAGLYSCAMYESADAFHKNRKPVAEWLSEKAVKA